MEKFALANIITYVIYISTRFSLSKSWPFATERKTQNNGGNMGLFKPYANNNFHHYMVACTLTSRLSYPTTIS